MSNEGGKTTVINVRGRDREELLRDENFRYVGRAVPRAGWKASPYGNPFYPGMPWGEACRVIGTLETPAPYERLTARNAVDWFSYYIATRPDLMAGLSDLKGKALGCWCWSGSSDEEPDVPCHAVVLMRLAESAPDPEERESALSLDAASIA